MIAAKLTDALEDYLETIYRLVQDNAHARVRDIAKARGVKPGSVSPALKRLSEMGLVAYHQREYVRLTEEGERAARRVYSRHKLLMRFIEEVLMMPAPAAEEQACVMEHSLSDDAMDRLVRFFEFLSNCPNVSRDFLEIFRRCPLSNDEASGCGEGCDCAALLKSDGGEQQMSLSDLRPGQSGRVTQVNATGAIRQRLLDMGLLPDVEVRVARVAPAGDPVWIKLSGSQIALRKNEAKAVRIA